MSTPAKHNQARYGTINHAMGNPTSCRYPSPQWLQRANIYPEVRTYPSYADNLKCLTGDRTARYLIWQIKWLSANRTSRTVRELIDEFCGRAQSTISSGRSEDGKNCCCTKPMP